VTSRPGFLPAALLVVAANLVPLAGWWWNRTGEPEAAIELTEREAQVMRGGEQNSSVRLRLLLGEDHVVEWGRRWIDSAGLVALGFEADRVSDLPPEPLSPRAPTRRPAWILLRMEDTPPPGASAMLPRLVPVAAGSDPSALYRASGDRGSHIVVRGVIRVRRGPRPRSPDGDSGSPDTWHASVDLITPWSLHLPRSLVPVMDHLAPPESSAESPRYLVRLAMGRMHLPRITGVFPRAP